MHHYLRHRQRNQCTRCTQYMRSPGLQLVVVFGPLAVGLGRSLVDHPYDSPFYVFIVSAYAF